MKLPKEDWLYLTAWRWVTECLWIQDGVAEKSVCLVWNELDRFDYLKKKPHLSTFKYLLSLNTFFFFKHPLTLYTQSACTHTHTLFCLFLYTSTWCSLLWARCDDTHAHKSTHITETKPHVTTVKCVTLVFESKDACLWFFLVIYCCSSMLAAWNYGALSSGIRTILQRSKTS